MHGWHEIVWSYILNFNVENVYPWELHKKMKNLLCAEKNQTICASEIKLEQWYLEYFIFLLSVLFFLSSHASPCCKTQFIVFVSFCTPGKRTNSTAALQCYLPYPFHTAVITSSA